MCTNEESARLKKAFNSEHEDPVSIEWIEVLIRRYQIPEFCRTVAQEYANRAKLALRILPDTSARRALEQLADYGVSRDW